MQGGVRPCDPRILRAVIMQSSRAFSLSSRPACGVRQIQSRRAVSVRADARKVAGAAWVHRDALTRAIDAHR
jgi:hypothetical protein